MLKKKPYRGEYPSSARFLIDEDITNTPKQEERDLKWAYGVNITYTLRNLGPAAFQKYSQDLLWLAYQECERYKEYKWKFASFDVRLGRLHKGKDIPEIVTFQTGMHDDCEIMVFGPGYETPDKKFLVNKVDDIIEIARRYADKVSKQRPYKVIRLTIHIRDPKEVSEDFKLVIRAHGRK